MRLAIPIVALLLWGISTISFYGPGWTFAWFHGQGLWIWLLFPLPFSALLVVEAARRLRKPPKTRFPRD